MVLELELECTTFDYCPSDILQRPDGQRVSNHLMMGHHLGTTSWEIIWVFVQPFYRIGFVMVDYILQTSQIILIRYCIPGHTNSHANAKMVWLCVVSYPAHFFKMSAATQKMVWEITPTFLAQWRQITCHNHVINLPCETIV